jgi:hypothetical protein
MIIIITQEFPYYIKEDDGIKIIAEPLWEL